MTKKPSIGTGVLIGVMMTAPLLALMFVGTAFIMLPFPPFEMLDWVARNLRGDVLTFGIDTMVNVIIALGLPTSGTAKVAEHMLSIASFFMIGVVSTAIFFAVMNRTQTKKNVLLPGLLLGLGLGLPVVLFGLAVPSSITATNPASVIWTLGLHLIWGYIISAAWNTLAFRRTAPVGAASTGEVEALDRRSFLIQMGAGAAVITVAGAGVGALLQTRISEPESVALAASTPDPDATPLPNADDALIPAPGTRPEITPIDQHYRIDISALPPAIAEEGYTLPMVNQVSGANEVIRELTLDEIRAMPSVDAYITMSCISNRIGGDLISTTLWTGVPMQYFLEQVGVPEGATHLKIYAADGFDETVALSVIDEDERVMLCHAWAGEPLRQRHGFPLRIHIPNRYGMKQPKWITRMEFLDRDDDGYWVRRGWSKDALIHATSVIDTVALNDAYEADGVTFVPVGGIAWAGPRGIAQVEISVDNGEWQPAQLRAPISDRTWVIWRYDWAFTEGQHTFTVRCVEGDGTPQIERQQDVRPDGATGYHVYRA